MDKKKKKEEAIKKHRYFLPSDIIVHNKPNDIWVSFLGKVWNITPLVQEFKGKPEVKPLLAYAGKDISHWFDKRTGDIKYHIHPLTNIRVPYCPHGLIPHVPPPVPTSKWQPLEAAHRPYDGLPWWRDKKYFIGYLSDNPRPLRIINTMSLKPDRSSLFWVAAEEKMVQILQRLALQNSHLSSYTLKFMGGKVNMSKTLEENRIKDERKKFGQLGLADNHYVPAIHLCFNDDLTG